MLSWILYFMFYHYVIAKRYVDVFGLITISPHIFAFLLSFAVTFFTGFFLNYYLVFRSDGMRFPIGNRLFRYFVANMGSVVLNYLLLKLFVEKLHWYPTPSQILCTSIITIY
ncbi:GtrA family protein, partial [Brucella sp. 21LCYQ03]|nr:GtrA family protein [Brucella sp. 21LCYQ03]